MPASYGPPWGRGSSYRRATDPNLRVSHADRTAVADRLSKHYGDGRLDEDEFNERLDRAMQAKTQGELEGLFADLPDAPDLPDTPGTEVPKAVAPRRYPRPLFPRIVFFVLIFLLASAVWHALTPPFWGLAMGGLSIPWLLVAVVVFLLWRSGWPHRRR